MFTAKELKAYLAHVVLGRELPRRERLCPRTGPPRKGPAPDEDYRKALENGYRCQFVKAQDLFDEMYASLADRSTRQLLNRLARLDVLLIDEFGYLNLKPEQSNIFFKLMEERYRRRPTIITTNLVHDEWPNFLGNRPMVEALLSRLRHYCHTVVIDGPPLREPQG
jgi:DNA replication protein DnaC